MFTSSLACRFEEAIPDSIKTSIMLVVALETSTWGTSLNPALISLIDKDFKSPLNNASEILIASSSASLPWINSVTFSASAFWASRKCGASSLDCSRRLISSLLKNVKYFKNLITSSSDWLIQNW